MASMNCASRSGLNVSFDSQLELRNSGWIDLQPREQRTFVKCFTVSFDFVFCYFQTRRGQRSGRVLVATDVRHSRGTRVSK